MSTFSGWVILDTEGRVTAMEFAAGKLSALDAYAYRGGIFPNDVVGLLRVGYRVVECECRVSDGLFLSAPDFPERCVYLCKACGVLSSTYKSGGGGISVGEISAEDFWEACLGCDASGLKELGYDEAVALLESGHNELAGVWRETEDD